MWKCPVCDQENNAATVCPTCGYDRTCDYERYPTAFTVTTAKPTRTLRHQWQAKQNPPTNPQPQPAAPPTAQPAPTAAPAKKKSGLWAVLAVAAVIAFVIAVVNQAKPANNEPVNSEPANSSNPVIEYMVNDYFGNYVCISLDSETISTQTVEDTQNLLKEHSCTKLRISGGTVNAASMEQISKLTDVEEIGFYDCTKISDFDRLSGMPSLLSIDLEGSSESESELDLTGIEKIATLESLYISRFESVDLMELRNAVQLKSLWVEDSNNITNLNGLAGLTNLTQLDLISDQISDLRPLSALTNLKALALSWNSITDLTGLEALTNLTDLILDGNQVSDLQPLTNLRHLTDLCINGNRITSLTGLEGLTNLTRLSLDGNQISDLQPISNLTNLEKLSFQENQISDLQPISNLTNLTLLNIRWNNITSLSGLENLTNLTDIYAAANPLTDTSALEVSGCMDALRTTDAANF